MEKKIYRPLFRVIGNLDAYHEVVLGKLYRYSLVLGFIWAVDNSQWPVSAPSLGIRISYMLYTHSLPVKGYCTFYHGNWGYSNQ